MAERILDSMASDTTVDASSERNGVGTTPSDFPSFHRISAPSPATDDDFKFLRHIGRVIEAQTDLIKRSVVTLEESRQLLAKINDSLRR